MIRIGIVGSRRRDSIDDFTKVKEALAKIGGVRLLVSGGCSAGADRFAETIAKKEGYTIHIYYPDWKIGKHAGFLRNTHIANGCDILITAPAADRLGGTEDTIKKFIERFRMDEEEAIEKGRLILI